MLAERFYPENNMKMKVAAFYLRLMIVTLLLKFTMKVYKVFL